MRIADCCRRKVSLVRPRPPARPSYHLTFYHLTAVLWTTLNHAHTLPGPSAWPPGRPPVAAFCKSSAEAAAAAVAAASRHAIFINMDVSDAAGAVVTAHAVDKAGLIARGCVRAAFYRRLRASR